MKRTFFAVEISDETKELLKKIAKDIPEIKNNVKLVAPEISHLTLKFIGSTDEKVIPLIISKIEDNIGDIREFEFTAEGTGVFPNASHPRVLWLGITKGGEELKSLSRMLDAVLKDVAIPSENREFKPHITFGRVKNSHREVQGIGKFISYSFKPVVTKVTEIVFFESKLTLGGPIYTTIKEFKF